MNQKEQIDVVKDIHMDELTLLKSKGNDYAGTVDVLKNFKEVSEICSILNIDSRSLYGTHLFYIVLKLQRLCNLLTNDKEPKNESIQDTIIDFRNYLSLLNCSIIEQRYVKQDSTTTEN